MADGIGPQGDGALAGWDDALTERLVLSLLADEIGRIRGRSVPPQEWTGWRADTRVDEDGLGADSLARLELVTRVNQFFRLHVVGSEDYLLLRETIGEWVALIAESLPRGDGALTFETSGSTGAPKRVTHTIAALAAECDAHAALLPQVGRVLLWTPPHHIYGFLFGALGPARRGLPVLDARPFSPARLAAEARRGDLIVATPFLWGLLARSGATLAAGVTGVVSTAPTPEALWGELAAAGLGRLIEIYGSTETAGLGWRDRPGAPFTPLSHVRAGPDSGFIRPLDGATLTVQDRIDWRDDGFTVVGRLDGAVQVGGVNVHLARIRDVLREHPQVEDCAVRLDGEGPNARLKAFVVTRQSENPATLDRALTEHCASRLSAPERPTRWRFGDALPISPTGKPTDWS